MIDGFSSRTKFLLLLAAVCAVSDGAQAEPPLARPPAAPRSGPCVLLTNHNVLFGAARQRGEFVVVRRGDGSEIQLSRKEVACWSDSLAGLYQYRLEHRQSHGIQAHLEEARWCLRYDLYDQAASELQAIYRVDPKNPIAKHLTQQLIRGKYAVAAQPVDPTKAIDIAPSIQLASHQQDLPGEDFGDQAMQRFARHIQPLLLNRCARCHGQDSNHQWKLVAPAFGSRPSARITQANLAATMRYVDTKDPLQSELRVRAVDGHAGDSQTLGTRAAVPTRALDWWLHDLVATKQRDGDAQPRHAARQEPKDDKLMQAVHVDAETPTEQSEPPTPNGIKRLPAVTNPFDPEIFNRRFHGGK